MLHSRSIVLLFNRPANRHSAIYSAYNNMCYLIEKYAPIDGIDRYDPDIDPSVTGARIIPHLGEGLI